MRKPILAVLFLLVACDSEYPPIAKGGRIAGTIRYQGTSLGSMTSPALRMSAAIAFPPVGQPHAIQIANPPDLVSALTGEGLPYELPWLPAYRYKVTAQLVDLDHPTLDYSSLPLGGYPDFCSLSRPNEGLVMVTEDAPSTGKDFVVYDQAGTGDPCTEALCPKPGKAAMRMIVKSSRLPTANDRLRVVLFQTEAQAIPSTLRIVPGNELAFPKVITDNTLTPGSYVLADACLDIGANSGLGKCTQEDFEAAYNPPAPPIAFPADRIVMLTADLDAQTLTVEGIEPTEALGCP